jgi:hypothetical protein
MHTRLQCTLAATALAIAAQLGLSNSAFAQVSFNIQIGPPVAIYEPVPMMAPGLVWAPGYWAWHEDRHVWIRGRTMVQRVGYRWQPDVWEQRNNAYYRHPGRWERDNTYRAQPRAQMIHDQPQNHGAKGKSQERGNSGKKRKDDNKRDGR